MSPGTVKIDYTNYQQQRGSRLIVPKVGGLRFMSNVWHPAPQWVLAAYDIEKDAERFFTMKDIHKWETLSDED